MLVEAQGFNLPVVGKVVIQKERRGELIEAMITMIIGRDLMNHSSSDSEKPVYVSQGTSCTEDVLKSSTVQDKRAFSMKML